MVDNAGNDAILHMEAKHFHHRVIYWLSSGGIVHEAFFQGSGGVLGIYVFDRKVDSKPDCKLFDRKDKDSSD